jgi:hypothetical protein
MMGAKPLWGLPICGGLLIRLRGSERRACGLPAGSGRRIANPPQVNNLPHKLSVGSSWYAFNLPKVRIKLRPNIFQPGTYYWNRGFA